jgi:hypothetical protein
VVEPEVIDLVAALDVNAVPVTVPPDAYYLRVPSMGNAVFVPYRVAENVPDANRKSD